MLEVNKENYSKYVKSQNMEIQPNHEDSLVRDLSDIPQIDISLFQEKQMENLNKHHNNINEFMKKTYFSNNDNSLNETNREFLKLNKNLNLDRNNTNNDEENFDKEALQTIKIKSSNDNSSEKNFDYSNKMNQNQELTHLAELKNDDASLNEIGFVNKNKMKNRSSDITYKKGYKRSQSTNIHKNISKKDKSNNTILLVSTTINLVKEEINLKKRKNYFKNIKFAEDDLKSFKKYDNNYLSTANEIEVHFKGKKEVIKKPKGFIVKISARNYIFPIKDSSKISSQTISIIKASVFSNLNNLIKTYTKIILIGTIYLFLWLFIAVFVESIYKQYGNNVFKICVMPLISMLFIKLVFIVNIMLLIATIIIYFRGKAYLNNAKNNIITTIIFQALVPPLALNHFSAITSYQSFCHMKR